MTQPYEIPYLILHRVRGEPAFDIGHLIECPTGGTIWIVTTSGHRAFPWRWWRLEDLADISDVNQHGYHDYPASFDHTIPLEWPDHYGISPGVAPKPPNLRGVLSVLGLGKDSA